MGLSMNRAGEARSMYQRATKGYEKAWGAEHMLTLRRVSNLGKRDSDQGKMEEAEAMHQRAQIYQNS